MFLDLSALLIVQTFTNFTVAGFFLNAAAGQRNPIGALPQRR